MTTSPQVATSVVASVPAAHVYVRHLAAEHDDGVTRLADPDPAAPHRSTTGTWWPPVMLRPEWVRDHDFDVLHVHFGFDGWDPADLRAVTDAVHERGRRHVQTVHDLRNPHHPTPDLHDAQLAVLLESADEVLTLTPGAAGEIRRRWGREARVVPHPHVVGLDTMARRHARGPGRDRAGFRVGLHLGSARPNADPAAVLPTLVAAVAEVPGGVLQVNGHHDLLSPEGARHDADLAAYLHEAHAAGALELRVHDRFSDAELWEHLAALDVSVLPYRFGTHSGWLEACRDLGTAVVAPTCGFYAEQGPVHSYVMDEERFDAASLHRAVLEAYDDGPVPPVTVAQRRAQRAEVARVHREVYRGERRAVG